MMLVKIKLGSIKRISIPCAAPKQMTLALSLAEHGARIACARMEQ
jgi:hypothetical protein